MQKNDVKRYFSDHLSKTTDFTAKSQKSVLEKAKLKKTELYVFLMVACSIILCELMIMGLMGFIHTLPAWAETLLDAAVLSTVIFPVIYYFLFIPFKKDISNQVRKEAEYSLLIENMGEGVGICDVEERFILTNPAAEAIFGVGPGELLGKELEKFFTKENYEFILNQSKQRREGKASVYEVEIVQPNGTVRKILVTATPQFENGIVNGTLAIFRDITAIKNAEDAIKYERNLLRALIDNLPDSVYVKDRESRKIISNPVDMKYLGVSAESDVLGKNDYDMYPKEVAESSFADDQYVFKTGQPQINKEDFFIDNQGQKHWMLNSKVPIRDDNGNIIGLVGIGRDITDRKTEETRLKLLESVITNATDAVTITEIVPNDSSIQRIIFVNDAFTKMTGYSKEEVIGKHPKFLQGKNTDPEVLKQVSNSIKSFIPCRFEVINYKKSGEPFWSSISISPISDELGNYTHWIAIKRDTTERKNMELEFIKAKEKAEAGSKAKSEFLANMSHEIRTPLNSVIGFSDLLMKSKLDDRQQQYISAVYQSANSLIEIINGILDFSKIEAGKLEIDISKTDLLELGYQVADLISIQANKKNLEMLLNISPDVPRFIWTDAVRLRQVLINLLGNAVKFTESGEIELKIELQKAGKGAMSLFRFSVRDTGIGIDPINRQKIFEAFSQEDSSINRKFGGTGLGLAISKRLLGLMGSELKVDSTLKQGSTFYFDIQLKTAHGEAENVEFLEFQHCKNVLIVDDNNNNRQILKEMLVIKGIQSEEALNGKEALDKLVAGKKFDAVLIDYHMPVMDGLTAIRNIRNKLNLSSTELPVMLLHSSADDEHINAVCKELDVYQRLVKPIKMKHLFEGLAKITNQGYETVEKTVKNQELINSKYDYFKVLVVDDNAFNILLIKTVISEILPNANIVEASDGEEAVACFKANIPDIIFMDIQMPKMNGYEATQAIRNEENGKQVPIIALTAGTLKEEKDKCMEAGMNDYVSKPYVTSTVVGIINKWLLSKSSEFVGDWII